MLAMPDRMSSRLDPNVAAALSYALGWVTGLAFLMLERNSRFVRFHAMQSSLVFGALSAASVLLQSVPLLNVILVVFVVVPLSAVLWLLLMFKAYRGEWFALPVVGPFAEARTR